MRKLLYLMAVVAFLATCGAASASTVTIDFETEDDFTTPLVDGQDISSPDEFGNLFNVNGSGPNLGAAIFDTDTSSGNGSGPDPDLVVDLGNALILQSMDHPTQTTSGVFDTPDDDLDGGTLTFDFFSAVELISVDLIDINAGGATDVTLTDGMGRTRVYSVPDDWTGDVDVHGPPGWATLFLNTLAPQSGVGPGASFNATASETAGFDAGDVVQLGVHFHGSAALDNLTFVPEPASLALIGLGAAALILRRRKA